MKTRVYVTLKKSVLDPQGKTVQAALDTMGYSQVNEVRCGKMIEVTFDKGADRGAVEQDLQNMCEKLLANTVIEDYRYEIVG